MTHISFENLSCPFHNRFCPVNDFFFLVKKDMFRTQRQHVARGFKFQIIAAGNSLYHNVILSHIEHQSVFFEKPQSVFLEKRGHKYY